MIERWISNLALFFALTVACGVAVGLIAALFGDGTLTGQSTTIVYSDGDGGVSSVETPNDDPQPFLLIGMPILVAAGSVIFALPLAAAWVGAVEIACRIGAPARMVRRAGFVLTALFAVAVLSGGEGTLQVFMVVGAVAFVALARMPGGATAT